MAVAAPFTGAPTAAPPPLMAVGAVAAPFTGARAGRRRPRRRKACGYRWLDRTTNGVLQLNNMNNGPDTAAPTPNPTPAGRSRTLYGCAHGHATPAGVKPAATGRAARSRSQGRKGWCILFHHPLRRDARNRPLRIRKGLATRDDSEADELVRQMNRLLQDESYWTPSARQRAAGHFDPRVVSIFFDSIEQPDQETWGETRGKVIPLRF
ncbi:MAG: hypothetical protein HY673_21340 [Chloroflexi bacterium]|nr:hypothetical protein [Chloroflexota bacterium]